MITLVEAVPVPARTSTVHRAQDIPQQKVEASGNNDLHSGPLFVLTLRAWSSQRRGNNFLTSRKFKTSNTLPGDFACIFSFHSSSLVLISMLQFKFSFFHQST
jgi:hypothetical protein